MNREDNRSKAVEYLKEDVVNGRGFGLSQFREMMGEDCDEVGFERLIGSWSMLMALDNEVYREILAIKIQSLYYWFF